jgi:hypothetical protein
MKINCIHCGHSFPLSDAYDDFEGPVKCPTCRGILEIRAQNATLKMVRPFSFAQMAGPVVPALAPQPVPAPAPLTMTFPAPAAPAPRPQMYPQAPASAEPAVQALTPAQRAQLATDEPAGVIGPAESSGQTPRAAA